MSHPAYKHVTRDELRVFRALDIHAKSIERLYEVFVQIDRDGSGEISVSEFFRFFSHKRRFPKKSKFAKRVFAIMDADSSGELDFSEFVIALWNFCTFTKPSLLRFSFELYDTDGSGYLDAAEIKLILREVYGKVAYKKGQAAKYILETVERMIETGANGLTISDFCDFCRHHPALLFPAFELQQALQQNVLGSQFWAACAKRREKGRRQNNKSTRQQKTWSSTADMSINELNAFLESWRNAAPASGGEWGDDAHECLHPDTNPLALDVEDVEDVEDEEDEGGVISSQPEKSSATTHQFLMKHPKNKYAIWKNRENGKGAKRVKPLKKRHAVLKKVKPWTCVSCGRMNTHSLTCGTCQRSKTN